MLLFLLITITINYLWLMNGIVKSDSDMVKQYFLKSDITQTVSHWWEKTKQNQIKIFFVVLAEKFNKKISNAVAQFWIRGIIALTDMVQADCFAAIKYNKWPL